MKNLDLIFDLLIYEGSTTNDPKDAIKVHNKIQETEVQSNSKQQLAVADNTTDLVISLPDANSDYLIILTDRDISIKHNGSSTAETLKTRAPGKKTLVFYHRGPTTTLTLSNSSGAVANVDIIIANK
jgi:hypothetical protein